MQYPYRAIHPIITNIPKKTSLSPLGFPTFSFLHQRRSLGHRTITSKQTRLTTRERAIYSTVSFSKPVFPIMADKPSAPAWHAAYPAPQTTADSLSRETLLSWMKDGKIAGKDFVLVDLRRIDHQVSSPTTLYPPASGKNAYDKSGRHYQRLNQPASSDPLSHHTIPICSIFLRRHKDGNLVLW
jgi:hypothetical protein